MAKLTVKDVELKGKKVLVRVDFNVPLKDGVITNDNRISAALPTIKYILEHGGRAILFSHLGRVKEEADKEGKSLAPVAADLAKKLGQDVAFLPGVTRGAELEAAINALKDGEVLLVENTRFEDVDGKKESKNDPELGKYWASLGDGIFVMMHLVQLTVLTLQMLVFLLMWTKQLQVSFLKTKLLISKKLLKIQFVHLQQSQVVLKYQTRLVLSKIFLKKLIKSLSVVV